MYQATLILFFMAHFVFQNFPGLSFKEKKENKMSFILFLK